MAMQNIAFTNSEETLADRHAALVAACDAVNADKEIAGLVEEWQSVNDPIKEPWEQFTAATQPQ
jgi:hypothetical protein